ncbi:MAG TPA: alpha/beta hydrolase [Thermoanaerobaculia bacterium]|nr:alpha/beta hydrolase [Thermoanaerobaculia bacterium]
MEVEAGGPEGAAGGTVLLVPGLGYGTSLWSAQWPALAEQHRLVALCPRGSGRSAPAPAAWSVAGMAADLLDVLDRESLPAAHLVGASLGGLVCLEAARQAPERVLSFVLLSTALIVEQEDFDPEVVAVLTAATRDPNPETARRGVETALAPLPADAPADVLAARQALVDRILAERWKSPPSPEGYRAQAMAGALYMAARLPADYKGPALVISGTADRVIRTRRSRELAASLPNGRFLEVEGAGHLVGLEKPEVVNAAIVEFLQEVKSR